MNIDIIVKQKGLFKKPIPLYKKLDAKYKCGTHDENYVLEDGKIDKKFLFYDPKRPARGILVEYDSKNKDDVKFRLQLPTDENEIEMIDNVIEKIKDKIKCSVEIFADKEIFTEQDREKRIDIIKQMNKKAFDDFIDSLKSGEGMYLSCVKNPIFFGKHELEMLEKKYDLFGSFLNLKQNLSYKYIEPVIYEEKNKKHIIVYKVYKDESVILPYTPYLLANVNVSIDDFFVYMPCAQYQGVHNLVRYDDFLNEVTEKLYYDDKNFAMLGMSCEKIQYILEKYSLQEDCVNL